MHAIEIESFIAYKSITNKVDKKILGVNETMYVDGDEYVTRVDACHVLRDLL